MNSVYSRTGRAQSVQIELDRYQPDYITNPKIYMKSISKKNEFQDPNGQVLKDMLIDEFSTIEQDYKNIERVKINQEKQRQYFLEKQDELDMKTQQKLWTIEQNRITKIEKKIKEKKQKNKEKQEEIKHRQQELKEKEREQYLQKLDQQKEQMDKFLRKKEEDASKVGNFQYDYSQYNKMMEFKQKRTDDELNYTDSVMMNLQNRQNRVGVQHDKTLMQKQIKLALQGQQKEQQFERSKQYLMDREQNNLTNLLHKLDKMDIMQEQSQHKRDQHIKTIAKKRKDKFENHKHNLEKLEEEQQQKNMELTSKHNNSKRLPSLDTLKLQQSQGSSPVKTMLQMTMEKKELNDFRAQKVRENKMKLERQKDYNMDSLMAKQKMNTMQKDLVKDVRQKIRDYRMKARFQQREDERKQQLNQSYA